jgi:hypothetical protein
MNKYPLIGITICVVVLLILSSLTNVIGYQSVQANEKEVSSPLFSTRVKHALGQTTNVFTSQYIGKGKNLNLFLQKDSNRPLREAALKLHSMSNGEFNVFLSRAVYYVFKDERFQNVSAQQLRSGLEQIRNDPGIIDRYINDTHENITWRYTPTFCWFPGCAVLVVCFMCIVLILTIIIMHTVFWPVTCSYEQLSVCFCPRH